MIFEQGKRWHDDHNLFLVEKQISKYYNSALI